MEHLDITILWSSGQTGANETNLVAGNYVVTITDANSCTTTQPVTVSDTSGPTASMATSDASCGDSNGTATAIVSGGTFNKLYGIMARLLLPLLV